ncbi:MAG: 50S ribosomal protein L23 [Gammaproteobacteria bacterium]
MSLAFNEYKILLGPVMSEKSMVSADKKRCFVFKVAPTATKLQIRNAVEKMFEVKVQDVNVVNVSGKTKRFRFRAGRRNDIRKAYVKLAEGHDINFGESAAA